MNLTKVSDDKTARTNPESAEQRADNLHWVVIHEGVNTAVRHAPATKAVKNLEIVIDVLCMQGEITQAAKGLLLDQTKNITTEIGMIP